MKKIRTDFFQSTFILVVKGFFSSYHSFLFLEIMVPRHEKKHVIVKT